jgi:hypothetical protein
MNRLRRLGRLLLRVLRELADESAYQRHLEAHGRRATPEEWRRFSDQRQRDRFSRLRCC